MDQHKLQYLKYFNRFQQNREKHFAPKLKRALKNQYQQFLTHYKAQRNQHNAIMAITSQPIHAILQSLYVDAGVNYGAKVYSQLPKAAKTKARMPFGFGQGMIDLIMSWFDAFFWNDAESITQTTREAIVRVMQTATEEGKDYNWIESELVTQSNELSATRARLIARTETVTASNQAAFFAAAKTGLMMQKEWLSAGDNRVRPDHANVNGSRVDMEDYFTVGDSKMLLPGARVQENGMPSPASEVCNCRCVVLYDAKRDSSGRLIEYDYGVWINKVEDPKIEMKQIGEIKESITDLSKDVYSTMIALRDRNDEKVNVLSKQLLKSLEDQKNDLTSVTSDGIGQVKDFIKELGLQVNIPDINVAAPNVTVTPPEINIHQIDVVDAIVLLGTMVENKINNMTYKQDEIIKLLSEEKPKKKWIFTTVHEGEKIKNVIAEQI